MQTYVIFSALYAPHMGGVEAYTAGLADKLAEQGNRVIVVTSRLASEDAAREVQPNGVEVVRLPCRALMGDRLPVPLRDSAWHALLDEVTAAQPTRVVVNTRFYGHSLDGVRFAQANGLPAVILEHGSDHLSLGNAVGNEVVERYEHAVTKRIKSFGYPFAGVSAKAVEWLEHFGIEGIGVVPNALDACEYAAAASERDFRAELDVDEGQLLVAVAGRLVPEKGIAEVLEAARYVDGVVFAIAGDGPLLEDVQAAGGTVRALGRLASADVAALLRDADVYLLPSRSEGFATTLLEACAMGAFPVSTDVGGVTELGIGEIGGAVLPDMSAASIAGALQAVASMPDECRAQADALMARVRERNTWEESARALESLFDDLNKTADDADATAVDADTNDDDVPFEGDERLDKLHRVLLMMMKDFAAICEREGLTWMAHYGTAIGALRHGGFIPWDDDIDICMFRSDLERFEQAVQADTSGKYSIVNARTHAGYPLATTRFILNGTEFRDSALATMDFPSGIFLDLFPLDELADGRGAYAVQVVGSWLFNKLATAKLTANPYIAAKGVTATAMSAAAKVARGALNLPGVRELDPNKVAHKLVTSHGGEKTKRAGYPFDTFPQGCIYNADDLLPVRWIPFEDMLISVPNKVEQQLTDYYGDWMTPPPGNERKAHYPDILDFGEYADL